MPNPVPWGATTARAVSELIAEPPDLSLRENRAALSARRGIAFGPTSLSRFVRAQQITLTKRACTPPSRTVPT